MDASLRALVVPVRRRPASRFINSTISNRWIFLGLFQSTRTDLTKSINCVMSALYALIDSAEKITPGKCFQKYLLSLFHEPDRPGLFEETASPAMSD